MYKNAISYMKLIPINLDLSGLILTDLDLFGLIPINLNLSDWPNLIG